MKERSTPARNQSGRPGAGKGQREDVRGSKIYPASGPLPPGPATVKTAGSLGRREVPAARRGSAGAIVARTRAGGRTTAATARVAPKRAAAHRALTGRIREYPQEIANTDWEAFLDDFSKEHEDWESEIRVFQPDQTARIETRGLPFEGISLDYKANECTTTVSVGTEAADHLQRLVARTTRIIALNPDELEVDAADRSRTIVRCRKPSR